MRRVLRISRNASYIRAQLADRKQTILKSIENQGKLSDRTYGPPSSHADNPKRLEGPLSAPSRRKRIPGYRRPRERPRTAGGAAVVSG